MKHIPSLDRHFLAVLKAITSEGIVRATKYVSPKLIIRAVRRTFKAFDRKPRKDMNMEVIMTIGKPNYIEREFIKVCQKAGEPFPVKKVQLKVWNPKKKNLKKRGK